LTLRMRVLFYIRHEPYKLVNQLISQTVQAHRIKGQVSGFPFSLSFSCSQTLCFYPVLSSKHLPVLEHPRLHWSKVKSGRAAGCRWVGSTGLLRALCTSRRFARPDAFAVRSRNTKDVSIPTQMSWRVSFAMLVVVTMPPFASAPSSRHVTSPTRSAHARKRTQPVLSISNRDTIILSFH
jgi:hypothetical protein